VLRLALLLLGDGVEARQGEQRRFVPVRSRRAPWRDFPDGVTCRPNHEQTANHEKVLPGKPRKRSLAARGPSPLT
jgi:hypothetical protein